MNVFWWLCEYLPNLYENLQKLCLISWVFFKILVDLEQFTILLLWQSVFECRRLTEQQPLTDKKKRNWKVQNNLNIKSLQEWHKTKQKMRTFYFFYMFLFVVLFLCILVHVYYKVVLRLFNCGSFDVWTDYVMLAVWQIATLKDTLSKYICYIFTQPSKKRSLFDYLFPFTDLKKFKYCRRYSNIKICKINGTPCIIQH